MRTRFLFIFIAFCSFINAQNAKIRGNVFDAESGEILQDVKVFIEGTQIGALTDIEGKFELTVNAGTYSLVFRVPSHSQVKITDLIVKDNEVKLLDPVGMSIPTMNKKEIVVTAKQIKNNERQLISMKIKAPSMIDGITSATFKATGDNDAASAMKRVTGVSISDGKYVFVRGIGDRYNKTLLNGMEIPGLDPDKNTLQMDIFPTNIIENLIVNKSFISELPADFAGGVIDINLKEFPDKKLQSVYISGGYNPAFHFNQNYLSYAGGKLDFIGFDDGTRKIPAVSNIPLFAEVVGNPTGTEAMRYKEILNSFSKNLSAIRGMSLMNFGLGGSFADDKKTKKDNKIGYILSVNYTNNQEYYSDITYGRYGLNGNASIFEMEDRVIQSGELGVQNVLSSILGGISLKTKTSKLQMSAIHLQNGESSAGIFDYISTDQGADFNSYQHNLSYTQRSFSNLQLSGLHKFDKKKIAFTWHLAPTFSTLNDPDIRITRYEERDNGVLSISTETGFPERIWRDLREYNVPAKVSITKEYDKNGKKGTIKVGAGTVYKNRSYVIRNYVLNIRGNVPLTGNPDELFEDQNLWPYNGDVSSGTTFEAPFIPTNPNQFNSNISNTSIFIHNEHTFSNSVKTIAGFRSEYYVHRYTGQDQLGSKVLTNAKVLENLGWFPTFSMILTPSKRTNIRFAYGKTIARPSFKELSYAEIFDPITGRTFIGGLFKDSLSPSQIYWTGKLRSTDIHNLDFRFETMPDIGKLISVSLFYKRFINPIEIIQYAIQDNSFQPRNVGNGDLIGGEFEYRDNLGWITDAFENLELITNLTYSISRIKLNQIEYESRIANAREGQSISEYRQMAGQAPYVINAGLNYKKEFGDKKIKGIETGVFYNVQGPTLYFVGIVDRPDIYTVPFHSLNYSINSSFGKDKKYNLALRVNNILGDYSEQVFKSFNASDKIFTQIKPGRTISFKLTYNF